MSELHHRAEITTTEQAVCWLQVWDNEHLIPTGALPKRPWSRTSPRELASVAEALLQARRAVDAVIKAEGTYRP